MSHVILHLSDLHIKNSREQSPILDQSTNIVNTLEQNHPLAQSVIMLVTGDLSFSGKIDEFDLAGELFSNIREELTKKGLQVEVVCVPGNHDCDFLECDRVRETLITNIDLNNIDLPYIDSILGVQKNYREFINKFGFKGNLKDLVVSFVHNFEDLHVGFCLINSAWISRKEEIQGKLVFPTTQLEAIAYKDTELVITLLHHPYNWFESDNQREMRNAIERFSDVVLTGHEHKGENYDRKVQRGENTTYIEGLELQKVIPWGPSSIASSQFRSIEISRDSTSNDEIILDYSLYNFSNGHFLKDTKESDVKRLNVFARKNERYPEFTPDFLQTLDEPGARFFSDQVQNLTLANFYVYPDLKIVDYSSKSKHKLVDKPVLPFFFENKRVFIFGKEKTGKTALARTLCKEFYSERFSPILVSGQEIKGTSPNDLTKLVDEKYKTLYQEKNHKDLLQRGRQHKVLILDDFHACKFNDKEKRKFLLKIDNYFGVIIVLSSSDLQISELLSDGESGEFSIPYKRLHILPFGKARRSDLIEKWVRLGRESTVEDSFVIYETVSIERVLSKTLGRTLIPSVPIFIITLIMQHDHPERFHTSITAGSFASLYEALINFSLFDIQQDRKITLEKIHVFLSDFAYYLHKQQKKIEAESVLREWFNNRNERIGLTLDFQTVKSRVIQAQLLAQDGDSIGFKYDYAYYYYLAGYFELNKTKEQTLEEIHELIRSLPNYKEASLLNFISYRCNHPNICDFLVEKSDELYSEFDLINLATDFRFVGEELLNSQNQKIEPRNYHDARKKENEVTDILESAIENDGEDNPTIDAPPVEGYSHLLDEMVATFQLLDVNGQLLRNLSSSMDLTGKTRLLNHSLKLCLRQLKSFSELMDKDKEKLSQGFLNMVKAFDVAVNNDQENYDANELFSLFTISFIYTLIHSYAELLSTEETPLLLDYLANNEIDNDFLLFIKLLVKMFYFGEAFPRADLVNLRKEIKTPNFTFSLLIIALERYFSLFDVPKSEQSKTYKQILFPQRRYK